MSTKEQLEKALREYEKAHAKWMNISVFTDEGKAAKQELDKARKIWQLWARIYARKG